MPKRNKPSLKEDFLTILFKRCLRNDTFCKRFLANPIGTIYLEGYELSQDEFEELPVLVFEIKKQLAKR